MGRAAESDDPARGRHRAADLLPRRPAEGAEQVRAHLEHRPPRPPGPGLAVLRRVRDALASGRLP
jgi:hypothetical protein